MKERSELSVGDLIDLGRNGGVRAEIQADSPVLNLFSSLVIRFYRGDEELLSAETLFKCDQLGDCHFCFTADFSSVVLTKERKRAVFPTIWRNVYTFNNCPVFEEQFFSEVLIRKDYLVARKGELVLVENFTRLLLEKQGEIYRLVLDNNLSNPLFTIRADLEVF